MQKFFSTPLGEVRMYFVPEYITVAFPCDGGTDAASTPWDKITDVEYLAEAFAYCTVMVFKLIVEQLAVVNNNRHLYEALL